jgi:hypothetical protein
MNEKNQQVNALELEAKEKSLKEREKRLEAMEKEIAGREKAVKEKEKAKKQVLLRLAPALWNNLAVWADEDFRSINSQIEFLLAEAVRKHKKGS